MGQVQISVSINRKNLERKLRAFESLVQEADAVTEQTALESLARLVEATPYRYTGDTRKQWVRRTFGPMMQVLANPSKVMRWLEFGTKAHGPKHAKAMFIPLNRRAWEAGPKEVMQANAQARATGQWRNYGARAAGKKGRAPNLPYKIGIDFVWAKWVRGIKAMHIARDEQKRVTKTLRSRLAALIKKRLS